MGETPRVGSPGPAVTWRKGARERGIAVGELRLFRVDEGKVAELPAQQGGLERSLQIVLEQNLEKVLGVRFVASEHSTGRLHGGRIDTLGLDENGCPVILEYKRAVSENVVSQGLYYLDWLLDHRAEFKLLVLERFGKAAAEEIDWSAPRLICVAADFMKHDEHAIRQMHRNIDLFRYMRFGTDLLALELAARATIELRPNGEEPPKSRPSGDKLLHQAIADADGRVRDLYEELTRYISGLGEDVTEHPKKLYMVFRRIKNFACIVVQKSALVVYVKVDPDEVVLREGFTRDVRRIGHWGTGDLEIVIRSKEQLLEAQELIRRSYVSS
jgi:predicted transport protein